MADPSIADELQAHRMKVQELSRVAKEREQLEKRVGSFKGIRDLKQKLKPKTRVKLKRPVRRLKKLKLKVRPPSRTGLQKLIKSAYAPPRFPQRRRVVRRPPLKYPPQSNRDHRQMIQQFEMQKRQELEMSRQKHNTQSESFRRIMEDIRRIQNKSKRDDMAMQRRLRERKAVDNAMNLLKTPFIFKSHQLDMTGVQSENILNAPNAFKESPDNPHILKKRGRSILDTQENTLQF